MLKVTGRGIRTKWKTQGDCRCRLRRVESWVRVILTQTAPSRAGEVGCVIGQALPCTEGATGSSRRIFPKKEKDPLGNFGEFPCSNSSSLLSTPPPIRGNVRTSSWRELRLQAPAGAGCPATGSVPSYWAVCPSTREYPHLISEEAETAGTTQGRVPSDRECAHTPGSVCTSSWRKLRPQAHGRVRIKEGSACTPIAQRRPTIKKSG